MSGSAQPLLLVVVGPTASGKSSLALRLARQLHGEIVSCDSVAVYRGLDIGSAKPTPQQRSAIPHHGLDLFDPDQPCTAGDYARAARASIAAIHARGRLPIVAGGTGLYLRALLEGLAPAPQRNEPLRERLRRRASARGSAWLHRILQRLDPLAAAAIHPNDLPKIIRSLEVTLSGRSPQTQQWRAGREPLTGFTLRRVGLDPPRAELYRRINARAEQMFARGLLAETAALRERFGDHCRALTSLGYAQALAVLRGQITPAQALVRAQQGHRNYAKRQLTWFRRDPAIEWLPTFGEDSSWLP